VAVGTPTTSWKYTRSWGVGTASDTGVGDVAHAAVKTNGTSASRVDIFISIDLYKQ
jgi:hypothetical protein